MDKIIQALKENKKIGFDVTNPRKSFAGHTVYRLQLKIYDSPGGSPQYQFMGWKRFNEFKRLFKELKAAFPMDFQQTFPEFAKGNFFGRFDETVIEERRQAAIQLLMFALLHTEMMSHKSFQVFMESGGSQISTKQKDISGNISLNTNSSLSSSVEDLVETITEIVNEGGSDETTQTLSTVNEIVVPENTNECSDDEDNVFLAIDSNEDGRQSWLREARSICGDDIESLASEAANDFPIASPRESLSAETSVLLIEPLDDGILCPSPVSDDQPEVNPDSSELSLNVYDNNQNSTNTLSLISNIEKIVDSTENVSSVNRDLSTFDSELQEKFIVDEKMSKIIEKTVEEDDYVFQASVAMSNAIEQEEFGNFEAAFEMYKLGIGLLLRGVQLDVDVERREAVRRKTAQYLLRAEQLYKSTLQTSEASASGSSVFTEDNKWRFRLSDVKVFGVIDKVMLVQKVFSEDVFVMKVLHKQGAEYKRQTQSVKKTRKQPRNLYNCHFMTKLMNCVETPTGVYLLLEYISGGRLWDYLNIPLFHSSSRRMSSFNESHHSWNTSDCNNSFTENIPHEECTDIVDIPCTNYVRQGVSELFRQPVRSNSSTVTCKIKRSPSQNSGLKEGYVQNWAAQVAFALMDLHSKGVICRDFNPRNILIDSQGNIKLTYFSNVEGIDYSLDADAVHFLYTSPEVDGVFEPTKATDWWSYAAILFELLTGESLYSCHPDGINNRSIITLPRRVSNEACSLLAGLLKFDPKERLGAGPSGSEEIKCHPFFAGINWEKLK